MNIRWLKNIIINQPDVTIDPTVMLLGLGCKLSRRKWDLSLLPDVMMEHGEDISFLKKKHDKKLKKIEYYNWIFRPNFSDKISFLKMSMIKVQDDRCSRVLFHCTMHLYIFLSNWLIS